MDTTNKKCNRTAVPMNRKHKPVYVINEYSLSDGQHKNNSDVIGISLGKAQWCNEKFEPSVKVWRTKNGKISRQSEETTLTRALDLATLSLLVYDIEVNGRENNIMSSSVFGKMEAEVVDDNLRASLHSYLNSEENRLDIIEHIKILKKIIENIKL